MSSDNHVHNRLWGGSGRRVSRTFGVVGFLLFATFILLLADVFLEVLLQGQPRVQSVVETVVHGLGLVSLLTLIFFFFHSANSSAFDFPDLRSFPDTDVNDWNAALSDVFSCEKTSVLLSPKKLLPLMILSIFIAETAVMFMLDNIRMFSPLQEALIDSCALLIFLSPTFFFLHYQPLKKHYQERIQILKRLMSSEQRFHLALNAVNDSLWDYSPVSDEIFVSPQCEAILGYESGEIGPRGSSWKGLLHPEEVEHFTETFNSHLKGKTDKIFLEHRMKRKDGSWRWLLTRGQTIAKDSEGRALRVIGTHTDITQRKEAESALLKRKEQIRKLSHKLIYVSEEEKKRLARDLHDDFGQVLTAFQLGLEVMRDKDGLSPDDCRSQFGNLLDMVHRLQINLRNVCDELRPVILDDLGLEETIRWHLRAFVPADHDFEIEQKIDSCSDISRETTIVLYRIFQEALHNVLKHAGATRVRIHLRNQGESVVLTVEDNGKGLGEHERVAAARSSWGLGILGMSERATAVGGHLDIESSVGCGTVVKVIVPKGHGDQNDSESCHR